MLKTIFLYDFPLQKTWIDGSNNLKQYKGVTKYILKDERAGLGTRGVSLCRLIKGKN